MIEYDSENPFRKDEIFLTLSLIVTTFDAFANRSDPDQPAPIGAVWSGSTLFAH